MTYKAQGVFLRRKIEGHSRLNQVIGPMGRGEAHRLAACLIDVLNPGAELPVRSTDFEGAGIRLEASLEWFDTGIRMGKKPGPKRKKRGK